MVSTSSRDILKLLPLEKSIPCPCNTAFPLKLRVPVFVSTYSAYLLNKDSGFWLVGAAEPSVLLGVAMTCFSNGEGEGPLASESFIPAFMPLLAAKPIFGLRPAFGTTGAELKFGGVGRPPGAPRSPPGPVLKGLPGFAMLGDAKPPASAPFGRGVAGEVIFGPTAGMSPDVEALREPSAVGGPCLDRWKAYILACMS